jgi:NNP family nitrate/nitrite transporter-like MFS transporter
MTFLKNLFVSPEINPSNRKARSIPVLNPFDQYGRVFFFSWLGFMVAFLSWYAFPPLVNYSRVPKLFVRKTKISNLPAVDSHHQKRFTHDTTRCRQL